MDFKELSKMFVTGIILGNGPCLLICLPILVPYISGKDSTWQSGLKLTAIFSLSRIIAYSILGILAAFVYQLINIFLNQYSGYIKLFTGIIILLIGMIYLLGKNFDPFCTVIHDRITEKSNLNMFFLGLLIGLSPCLPLMGILTYIAAMSKNVFEGFLYGFTFGIGTLLSLIIPVGALAGLISQHAKKVLAVSNVVRIISGLILLFFGSQLILK